MNFITAEPAFQFVPERVSPPVAREPKKEKTLRRSWVGFVIVPALLLAGIWVLTPRSAIIQNIEIQNSKTESLVPAVTEEKPLGLAYSEKTEIVIQENKGVVASNEQRKELLKRLKEDQENLEMAFQNASTPDERAQIQQGLGDLRKVQNSIELNTSF